MDPLTHLLTGACLARTGLNRTSGLATAVLVISAEIADLDMLIGMAGPVTGFAHHRGFTHAFIGVPLDVAATLLLVWLWRRWRQPQPLPPRAADDDHIPPPPPPPPRWGVLALLACLGALSHLLLDFTNAYGLRPFLPFSWRWYHWDIVPIVDPVILLVLVCGLALPFLFGLIQEEIGARRSRGRAGATVALLLLVTIWGVRDFYHRRAVIALSVLTYEGEDPIRASAFPYEITPFTWHGVIETESRFATMHVDTLAGEVDPDRHARTYYKPEETEVTHAAKGMQLGRVYLDWADYPYTSADQPAPDLWRVRFVDLRYLYLEQTESPLGGVVLLDRELHETAESFGSLFRRREGMPGGGRRR